MKKRLIALILVALLAGLAGGYGLRYVSYQPFNYQSNFEQYLAELEKRGFTLYEYDWIVFVGGSQSIQYRGFDKPDYLLNKYFIKSSSWNNFTAYIDDELEYYKAEYPEFDNSWFVVYVDSDNEVFWFGDDPVHYVYL